MEEPILPDLARLISTSYKQKDVGPYVARLMSMTCKSWSTLFAQSIKGTEGDWDFWFGGHRELDSWRQVAPRQVNLDSFSLGAMRFAHASNLQACKDLDVEFHPGHTDEAIKSQMTELWANCVDLLGWQEQNLATIIEYGDMGMLTWFHRDHCVVSYWLWRSSAWVQLAAWGGRLSFVRFLHERAGVPLSVGVFSDAVCSGNRELIKWLHEKKCPRDGYAIRMAIRHHNVELAEWLRSLDCPWDSFTWWEAVETGDIKVLDWLFKSGCPYRTLEWHDVVQQKNGVVFHWLLEHGFHPPQMDQVDKLFATACPEIRDWWTTVCPWQNKKKRPLLSLPSEEPPTKRARTND